ncbi:MAG TPA: helix-hairpin-helix domain-containing protein [Pyrinomonadaceae bacterium]
MPRRTDLAAHDVSPRATQTAASHQPEPAPPSTHVNDATTPVSINLAPREELERLPGVGPALAARIVEHRERHGPFRRLEHLLLVRGISERRLRELRPFITTQ